MSTVSDVLKYLLLIAISLDVEKAIYVLMAKDVSSNNVLKAAPAIKATVYLKNVSHVLVMLNV